MNGADASVEASGSIIHEHRRRYGALTPCSYGKEPDCAEEQGFGWRPGPAWLPPQELRDASWRSSLAPDDVWERLDEAVEALSRARTGVSVVAIAQAFGRLSTAAWELANEVEQRQRPRASRAG